MRGYITEKIQEKQDAKYRQFDHMCEKMEEDMLFYPELVASLIGRIRDKVIELNDNPKKIEFEIQFGPGAHEECLQFPFKMSAHHSYYVGSKFDPDLERKILEKHERLVLRNVNLVHSVWNAKHPDAHAELIAKYTREYNKSYFGLIRRILK